MNVGRISSMGLTPISFKHYLSVDIGASSELGSCKIRAIEEGKDGKTLADDQTTVFDEGDPRDEEKFVQSLALKIADFEMQNRKKIGKEDKDVKLTVCYPGPMVSTASGAGVYLTNFYHDDARTDNFSNPIILKNVDEALKSRGINVVASRHVNDMAGCGACLLNEILKNDEYKKCLQDGEQIVYMYPGGGLGTGVIDVDKNEYRVRPTEMQHIRRNDEYRNDEDGNTIEMSACSHALNKNFAEALGLPKDAVKDAKLVTLYEEFREKFPDISETEHREASKEAILKLMDAIGELIAVKVCEAKAHNFILTGKIMGGVREAVNNNPLFDEYNPENADNSAKFNNCLDKMVQKHLSKTGKRILSAPDKKLSILFITLKDNTSGAHRLHDGDAVGNPPNWYSVKK